jgi:hypothetical protein
LCGVYRVQVSGLDNSPVRRGGGRIMAEDPGSENIMEREPVCQNVHDGAGGSERPSWKR